MTGNMEHTLSSFGEIRTFFVQKSGETGQIHVDLGQHSPRGGVSVRWQAQFGSRNNQSQENT